MLGNWSVAPFGISLRAWALTLFLSELGLIFLFMPASLLERVYDRERRMVASQLGESALANIEGKSASWFQKLTGDTGALSNSYALCERQGRDPFDDRGLGNLFANRLDVFWMAVRQMFFRFGMIELWLPCVLIFFPPVLADGYLQRQIRQNQFAYASPLAYHCAQVAITLLLMGVLLAPLMPLPMAPLAVPLGLGLIAGALWFGLVLSSKRF